MAANKKRYRSLSDSELVELLHTAADLLTREAVDEFLSRGKRILPRLAEIIQDKASWNQSLPEWWAVVHATYILGAMQERDALVPLLSALRWSDAFDCDWVTDDLPGMFAHLGMVAREPLEIIARDVTAGPGARSIALAALAALSIDAPHVRVDLVSYAAGILSQANHDLYLRQTCANLLVDFRSTDHRDLLLAFGHEEALRRNADPDYSGVFYDWEVDELLGETGGASALEVYRRDWLVFYDPEEIDNRQERWNREREDAEKELTPDADFPTTDPRSPCPCGSGWAFDQCCYLKIH